MSDNANISSLLTWNSPLTYFFLAVVIFLIFSVRYIITARKILRESGTQMQFDLFDNYYRNLFNWTSLHQTKTALILVIIVLAGILWVVNF